MIQVLRIVPKSVELLREMLAKLMEGTAATVAQSSLQNTGGTERQSAVASCAECAMLPIREIAAYH